MYLGVTIFLQESNSNIKQFCCHLLQH